MSEDFTIKYMHRIWLLYITLFFSKIGWAQNPFDIVLVDKAKNQLYLALYNDHKIEIQKQYHATLGKSLGDKVKENDLKTPEGVYFFTSSIKPPGIKKKFGALALMLNYPNPIDQLDGKTGYDIMLHATDDPTRLKRNLDSEGCVVVDNHEVLEISKSVRLGLTPMIIYPSLQPEYLQVDSNKEIRQAFSNWLAAWQNQDLESYISYYTQSFKFGGMNLKQYQEYKRALNERYEKILVETRNLRFFYHPKYDVVTFTQEYQSWHPNKKQAFKSSGTKVLYFVKENSNYKIANESFSQLKED